MTDTVRILRIVDKMGKLLFLAVKSIESTSGSYPERTRTILIN
jgi:hypothetical protein